MRRLCELSYPSGAVDPASGDSSEVVIDDVVELCPGWSLDPTWCLDVVLEP